MPAAVHLSAVAWRSCGRGDWMLRVLADVIQARRTWRGTPAHRRLVLAACGCARLALRYVPRGELRPRKAIEATEAWARRERGVTLVDVRAASADAVAVGIDYAAVYATVYAAYAVVDADAAARAAARAAHAAYAATYVAATAHAVYYGIDAARAARTPAADDAVDAKTKILRCCAMVVRVHFPRPPRLPTVWDAARRRVRRAS